MVDYGFLSLVPAILVVFLALITREVLLSLFLGIVAGALILNDFQLIPSVTAIWELIFAKAGDPDWNTPLLLFLALLGGLVALITSSGGSLAFGKWAAKGIKNRVSAQLTTMGLGLIIFIDDYFNALTVGTVMKPITDRYKISRAKLAYIIDSTAAPICILAPISSWMAYVMGIVGDQLALNQLDSSGGAFMLIIKSIPYNFYPLLALLLITILIVTKLDFGPMAQFEKRAMETGVLQDKDNTVAGAGFDELEVSEKGSTLDLLIPILTLVFITVISMLGTGGYFSQDMTIGEAFGETNAVVSLVYGSFSAIVVAFVLYIPRKLISFSNFMGIFVKGAQSMVPALAILILAWGIGGVSDELGTGLYLSEIVSENIPPWLQPALLFIVSGAIAFATGTSWGTFAIMLPIGMPLAIHSEIELLAIIAAVLGGAVFGDHCSPISDTTVLSSTGAAVNHLDHVYTQLPYTLLGATCSILGYILLGLTNSLIIGMMGALAALLLTLYFIKKKNSAVVN